MMAGIGVWQLVILALIIGLVFGTKKVRNLGGDLGFSIKEFKRSVSNDSNVIEDTSDNPKNSIS